MGQLLKQQQESISHLNEWKVGALFMEAGTGKTRVAIELANSSPCDLIVWIGPLRTIENTKTEVAKWNGFNVECVYYGVESISGSDRIYSNLRADVERASNPFVIVDESLKIKNIGCIL